MLVLCIGCSDEEPHGESERPIGEFIDDWTFRVFPEAPYNNFDIAEFRLWVPKETNDLRATLVLLTNHNGSALGLTKSSEWQAFAQKERLALLGVNLKSLNGTSNYALAGSGSGQALIDALKKIAEAQGILPISKLPLLMRGYSAGGNFSYNFSVFMPNKVVGVVSIRGGQLEATPKNLAVPGLILSGEMEGDQRNEYLREIALDKRSEGGLWSFAIEPQATHFSSLENSDALAKVFFSAILKKRISTGQNGLLPISEDSGWLGNFTGTEVFPYSDYPGNMSRASWLPDATCAEAWLTFQN
ncbi:hypothetical protein [Pareuzebyella sediminis]|uniref:hypothetical protein n=1 Tax=Pareuzebyella sediminis TaxID=2607998 RepID=UPI0011EBAB0D|nr:hypothetical protein [Pareuzebyella sediminis]